MLLPGAPHRGPTGRMGWGNLTLHGGSRGLGPQGLTGPHLCSCHPCGHHPSNGSVTGRWAMGLPLVLGPSTALGFTPDYLPSQQPQYRPLLTATSRTFTPADHQVSIRPAPRPPTPPADPPLSSLPASKASLPSRGRCGRPGTTREALGPQRGPDQPRPHEGYGLHTILMHQFRGLVVWRRQKKATGARSG